MPWLVAALGIAVLLAAVVVAINPGLFEVTQKGPLLSFSTGDVYAVRVLHSIDLYVDAESADPALGDVLNSLVLAAAAGSALLAAWLVAAPETPTPPKVVRFFALASAGAAFFAVDDIVGVHESIGDNARALARLPGIDQPDDVVVAVYALLVMAFLVHYRRVIRVSPLATLLFTLTIASFATGAMLDVATDVAVEEKVEIAASLFLLAAILVAGHTWLRSPPDPQPAGGARTAPRHAEREPDSAGGSSSSHARSRSHATG
jgi:hypothetical protein